MTTVSPARILPLAAALALLLGTSPAGAGGVECGPEEGQRLEMTRLIESWQRVRRDAQQLEAAPLPGILFFDDRCLWEVRDESAFGSAAEGEIPVDGSPAAFAARAHGGTIGLPDGERIPARLTIFVSTAGSPPQPYMVMPLLSIWRAESRHAGDAGLDSLVRAVFVHEMTHTRQSDTYGRSTGRLVEAHGLGQELERRHHPDEIESDSEFRASGSVSAIFFFLRPKSRIPCGARAWRGKRSSCARSATSGSSPEIASSSESWRRSSYMEGVANWAAYQNLRLEGVERGEAVERMRRGRARWSQDEGLGLYLALDALVPGWQGEVFRDRPRSAWELLGTR